MTMLIESLRRIDELQKVVSERLLCNEEKIDLFRLLFGHEFTHERLRLIAEVIYQAVGVRERRRKNRKTGDGTVEFEWAMDDFCRAVDKMEEETNDDTP